MKKILIIVVLSLTFTSCMTVSESRRQYIGKTYVVEMGTGKVYIEFASDKDCQIRPSEDYMGMFTYPCIYGSIMKKVDTKEISPNTYLYAYLDGCDFISVDSIYYDKKGQYISLQEYAKKDFLSGFILVNCIAFVYNPQKDEIICMTPKDVELFSSQLDKKINGDNITVKDDMIKFTGARGKRLQE